MKSGEVFDRVLAIAEREFIITYDKTYTEKIKTCRDYAALVYGRFGADALNLLTNEQIEELLKLARDCWECGWNDRKNNSLNPLT